jgi:putative addiction module component (TIGR02574 family)
MSVNISTLGIEQLSVADRLDLIEQIWNSLPATIEPASLPDWHREELGKRLENAKANPDAGKPWREVLGESDQ